MTIHRRRSIYMVRDFRNGEIVELPYTHWAEFVEMIAALVSAKRDFEAFTIRGGQVREKIIPVIKGYDLEFEFRPILR